MEEELKNIVYKVRNLYMKYGIKSVSMDDVARELGISKKTLYQFVEDKSELVKRVIDYEIEIRLHEFEQIKQKALNSIDELFEVNFVMCQQNKGMSFKTEYDLKKYYPDYYQFIRTLRRIKMLEFIKENLDRGKAEGYYRDEMDTEIIARLHVSRFESILDTEIFTIDEITTPKIMNEIFTYNLYGICNDNGIAYLKTKLMKT